MPDALVFTSGLPFDWVPTASYEKAYEWYKKHKPNNKMIHAQSPSSFLVLTAHGLEVYGKITNKLVKWYLAVFYSYFVYLDAYHWQT